MEKFLFADGSEICLYEDGKVSKFPSKFIENYKANAESIERSKSWKHSGEGAQFRGDVRLNEGKTVFESSINGLFIADEEKEIIYSFEINQTSGIYRKNLADEKGGEAHIITSIDSSFKDGSFDARSGMLALSVQRNFVNSDIAIFDVAKGDYKTVTDGDTLDSEPFISPDNANIIYFSSRGVGRDSSGNFACFSPSSIYRLDLDAVEAVEIKSDEKFSYLKPVEYNGKLYAIKTPGKEKGENPLLEIILIPFRIIQAIANFVNVFVRAFTGKSLASGGNNPTKGREYDSRREFIKGNLINVEKEMQKNRKKGGDFGFIPLSWQLIEVESGNVIKSGIADYDIAPDGTIICTNGKHIFAIRDGKTQKLCNTECCIKVSCYHDSQIKSDLFDFS